MLIMSLVLSAALLFFANVVARKSGRVRVPCVICGLGALLGWPCIIFPALTLTGVLTALSGILCRITGGGPPLFLKCSLVIVAASHVLIGILSWHGVQERRALREQFPAESLAQRLSYETPRLSSRPPSPPQPEGTPASKALTDLEDRVEGSSFLRTYTLKRLHEDSIADFINSPGFGITRRLEPHKEYIELPEAEPITLTQAAEEPPTPAAPAPATPVPVSSPADALAIVPAAEALREMHQSSLLDFVNAKGFGFIKDREQVRGFQAHQFHAVPPLKSPVETERWRIQSLELVSLLKHEEPVVYLSKHLPRMDELRDAPTRPLISFEKEALAALQKGENLRLETAGNRIHMLGSVRALNQCLACHRVQRGDLLGAFSYTLLRESVRP
jgi:hypothetical protein